MKKNVIPFSKPFLYLTVLFFLCNFNQAFATVSAAISGTATICNGSSTTISIALSGGTTPWNFTWTDGTTHHSVSGITSSPYTFSVSPTVNTTYTLVSDSDATHTSGTVSGSAHITVQMTGTYTINPAGSGAANFTSFTAAVSALTSRGVCGPVVFNISNDTFHEQITIYTITGASATNTITFQSASGDSSKVVITDTSSSTGTNPTNCTVCLLGGSYITFNKITMMRTGSKYYGTTLYIGSQSTPLASHNNTFTNNQIIKTGYYNSNYNNNIFGAGSYYDTACLFNQNYIQGGSWGIQWTNNGAVLEPKNKFKYNIITDFYSGGIETYNQSNCQIIGNTITNAETSATSVMGIYLDGGDSGLLVAKNIVYCSAGGIGIDDMFDTATAANPNIIENNFIAVGDTNLTNTQLRGIYCRNGNYINYYYNSISIIAKKTSTSEMGIDFTTSNNRTGNINFENNIVSTTGSGVAIYFTLSGTGTTSYLATFNYNDYYTRGTHLAYLNGTNENSLSAWQTAISKDANSISIKPLYINDTADLQTFNPSLKAGTPLSSVTNDIYGDTRSSTTPDIGAYEFTPTGISGSTTVCASSTATYTTPSHSGSSYAWTVTGGTISSGGSTYSAVIAWGSAGTGTLKIVETNGLYKDSVTATITINALPTANTGSTSTFCNGGSTTIGASAVSGDTYSWTSNPAGFTSTTSNPSVSPTTTTTYTLVETITATECTKSNTIIITVNPLPTANAGSAQSICNGSSTTIGSTAVSGDTYSWTSSPSGFTSTVANPSASPTTTTTYTLTETITATECTKSNTIIITVNPLPSADAGSTSTFCNGGSATIGASAVSGDTYSWTSSPSGFTSTASNPSVSPTVTTTYTLTETITATGCTNTNSVIITVNPVPVPMSDSANMQLLMCRGGETEIGDDSTGGYSYSWTASPSGTTPSGAYGYVTPTLTTTYHLTETITATGCSTTDTIIVTIDTIPAANPGSAATICGGDSAVLGATAISGHSYIWTSNPIGFFSYVSNPSVRPIVTTTFYITEFTSAGCDKSDSVIVTVLAAPAANVGTDSIIFNCDGSNNSINIGDSSISGHTYSWTSSPSGFTSTAANPSISPTTSTVYTLVETITATGCTHTNSIRVAVKPSNTQINLKLHYSQTH